MMDVIETSFKEKGYLSLRGFVSFLSENYPLYKMSYVTALKLAQAGELGIRIGGVYRISENEARRWVTLDEQPKKETIRIKKENLYGLPENLKYLEEQ